MTLELCYIFVPSNYVRELRYTMFFLIIYLFDVVTFFDEVRITLYFDTFKLRREIT